MLGAENRLTDSFANCVFPFFGIVETHVFNQIFIHRAFFVLPYKRILSVRRRACRTVRKAVMRNDIRRRGYLHLNRTAYFFFANNFGFFLLGCDAFIILILGNFADDKTFHNCVYLILLPTIFNRVPRSVYYFRQKTVFVVLESRTTV